MQDCTNLALHHVLGVTLTMLGLNTLAKATDDIRVV